MLKNGGFEVPWEQNYKVKVFPVDAPPYVTEKGEFHTPEGWLSWFKHDPGNWDQPEVGGIWKKHVSYRVHSGEKAAKLFTFYRKHWAGFMQEVQVGRGKKVTLTAYAHGWSNHPIEGHEDCTDEGQCSAGVGFGGWCLDEDDIPPTNGDPWNDAKGNMEFRVGIDPAGGTNPFDDTVVWGYEKYIYNEYCKLEAEAVAQSDTVTVFLSSKTKWQFKHNDAYWDTVELEIGEGQPPQECHCPRENYDKTVVLLPQNADANWRQAVAIVGDKPKWSIIQSADDAFIGPPNRTIYAVNPGEWPGSLKDFAAQYYPGATIVEVNANTPWEAGVKLLPELTEDIALGQAWEDWKDEYFGEDLSQTIGRYGCLLVGLSVVLRKVYKRDLDPITLDKLLVAARVAYAQGNLLMWESAVSLFPKLTDPLKDNNKRTASQLQSLLQRGYEVILRQVDGSHFVYLESVSGNTLNIIDTYDGERKQKTANEYAGVRAARVEGVTPPPPPPPPSSGKRTGLHLQHMEEGWPILYDAGCSIAKVFSAQDVLHIMRHNENCNIVLRNYVANQEPFYNTDDHLAAGVRWIDKVRSTLYEVCDQIAQEFPHRHEPYFALESVNEEYENVNYNKNTKTIGFDVGFSRALDRTDLPVNAGVYCAAVGNLHESQYNLLVGMARDTNDLKYEPWWGYHNYFIWNGQYGGPAHLWKYLAGRWEEIDKVLVNAGYQVKWYGGESGCIRGFSSPPEPAAQLEKYEAYNVSEVRTIRFPLTSDDISIYQQDEGWVSFMPNDGWRHSGCYAGEWMPHQEHVLELQDICMNTHAGRRGDWLGNVLFTSCPPYSGWKWFWVKKPQINLLATR